MHDIYRFYVAVALAVFVTAVANACPAHSEKSAKVTKPTPKATSAQTKAAPTTQVASATAAKKK